MKTKMILVGCAAVLIAVAAQAETGGGAFRFLNGEGDALSLFGVRLGQKMAAADTCPPWHNHLTARSDQYEYCRFTPSGEAGDTRFRNYTVCLDRTNRQVVAVFASAVASENERCRMRKQRPALGYRAVYNRLRANETSTAAMR